MGMFNEGLSDNPQGEPVDPKGLESLINATRASINALETQEQSVPEASKGSIRTQKMRKQAKLQELMEKKNRLM